MTQQTKPNQQLQTRPAQGQSRAMVINPNPILMAPEHWERLKVICNHSAKSGLLPKAIDTPEKAFIVVLKGIEMGFTPMYALEHVVVINGKASIDGQAMLKLIYERCPQAKLTWVERTTERATVEIQRPGQGPTRVTFTMEDAKRAQLTGKQPWQQYPRAMLTWRALTECARLTLPDKLGPVYMHEELGFNVDADGRISEELISVAKVEAAREALPSPASPADAEPSNFVALRGMFAEANNAGLKDEDVKALVQKIYPQIKSRRDLNEGQCRHLQQIIRAQSLARQAAVEVATTSAPAAADDVTMSDFAPESPEPEELPPAGVDPNADAAGRLPFEAGYKAPEVGSGG